MHPHQKSQHIFFIEIDKLFLKVKWKCQEPRVFFFLKDQSWRIYAMILKLTVKEKVAQSCLTLCDPHGLYSPWNSPDQNTKLGSFSPLQGIFPTQGSNPGLLYCMQMLYQLSHEGSPRILEWVACPFSSRSS